MADEASINQLLRNFGGRLDRDVLQSVLLICGGDVQQATQFLQVQNADTDYIEDQNNTQGESLPPNYMALPSNFKRPKAMIGSEEGISGALKEIFLSDKNFLVHLKYQEEHYPHYIAVFLLLITKGISIATNTKARVLACAFSRHDWDFADYLLSLAEHYGLLEVLKAMRILDAPRRLRALEKKMQRYNKQGTAKPRTIGFIRAKMNDLRKDIPCVDEQKTSVTGSLCKRIKKWVATIDAHQLAFFAIQLPKEPWRELSDIIHFHPKDFQLPYFLSLVYNEPPPKGSVVEAALKLNKDNVLEITAHNKIPYSFLRKQIDTIPSQVKACIAKYEKLDALIWYHEELACDEVNTVIAKRLADGEKPKFSYGKLMERLLYFKTVNAPFFNLLIPIAEERLAQIKLPLEPPVVVFGDASYSMDVAIRTATIIGSLLTALTSADLKFFNVKSFGPTIKPRTVGDVLDVATKTKADGLTAPACTIWEYYKQKKKVKFFVMVTDEIENEKSDGQFFGQLFWAYYTEVYPAKLVFVSFLEDPSQKGRMVRCLENMGLIPLQFRLDSIRPDLTKVDSMLGILSSECAFFHVQADSLATTVKHAKAFKEVLAKLSDLPLPKEEEMKQEELSDDEAEEMTEGEKGKEKKDFEIPDEFLCPITNDIMENPVVAADGHTYEKEAIEAWFAKKQTSPMTNADMESTKVYPNFSLKSRIQEYLQKNKRK